MSFWQESGKFRKRLAVMRFPFFIESRLGVPDAIFGNSQQERAVIGKQRENL
jgi:hypothetical protein